MTYLETISRPLCCDIRSRKTIPVHVYHCLVLCFYCQQKIKLYIYLLDEIHPLPQKININKTVA